MTVTTHDSLRVPFTIASAISIKYIHRTFFTTQDVKAIIEEYDVDGNDSLDFSEFLMLISKLDPRIGQEIEINKAFKLFDKDNNGYITR